MLDGSRSAKPVTATTELEVIPLPTGITGVEGSYTDALLAAYGQVEGIKHFTIDMLDAYPAHKENFSNQRKYYLQQKLFVEEFVICTVRRKGSIRSFEGRNVRGCYGSLGGRGEKWACANEKSYGAGNKNILG